MITEKQRGYLKGLIEKLLPPEPEETEPDLKLRWLEWLRWAVGRDDIRSTDDLTSKEGNLAITKARAGELPNA